MRGPDRKGVRGLSNMTDSSMVGGHRPASAGSPLLHQAAYVAAILAGVAALWLVAAFLGSESPSLKLVAWSVIGVLVILFIAYRLRRHRNRQSLDDVLRSRRDRAGNSGSRFAEPPDG